jgi:hypothetical protein
MPKDQVRQGSDSDRCQVATLWEVQFIEVRVTGAVRSEPLVIVTGRPLDSALVVLDPEGVDRDKAGTLTAPDVAARGGDASGEAYEKAVSPLEHSVTFSNENQAEDSIASSSNEKKVEPAMPGHHSSPLENRWTTATSNTKKPNR